MWSKLWFSSSHVQMWELDNKKSWAKEVMPSNGGAGEDSLKVPWTARRSNQSILKEISPQYSLEGQVLKLQYFSHLMWRADSLEKTLMLEKIKGKRRRGRQRMGWFHSITNSMDMNLNKLQQTVKDREDWYAAVHRVTKSWARLTNCTTTTSWH